MMRPPNRPKKARNQTIHHTEIAMDKNPNPRTRKRRKREKAPPPLSSSSGSDQAMFPQMLASISNIQNPHTRSILKRLLRANLAFIRTTPPSLLQLLPHELLSLLPLLLNTNYPSIAVLSAEIVGVVALCSLEANAVIASDGEVVKGLVSALDRRSRRVLMAACNSVMDLSTAPIGRDRLRESFAIEKLLSVFCQMKAIPLEFASFRNMEKENSDCSKIGFINDNLPALVLDAVVILINTSSEDYLDRIPGELLKSFLPLLKEAWNQIKGSTLPSNCSREQSSVLSTTNDLAGTIFRLSMNRAPHATCEPDAVKISIFGSTESEFKKFILNYWESSPYIFRKASENLEDSNSIFSSLVDTYSPKTSDGILSSILQGAISCLPIASDELDIHCFLSEVNGGLGSPMMYGQDIRVLKTRELTSGSKQEHVNEEVHFFMNNMPSLQTKSLESIDIGCIKKCKQAFQDGYTIAVRGMEFRSDKVAAIANGLANLFGQPSVGANIYLTPPKSQGLASHYDDHCVFVWQLFGRKQWRILPRPTTLLPRLYEPLCNMHGLEGDACGGLQFLLEEGDILYIPRGYPHEAHTTIEESVSENDASTDFSVHLTLGIEVELPFEWEGFVHIALHCWNEKQKQTSHHLVDSRVGMPRAMIVSLLHVAIMLIADHDLIFRKACMVAAISLSSDVDGRHDTHGLTLNHEVTFGYIIDKINASSSFLEAFTSIKAVVQEKNFDSLQWMRWLRHLPQEGDENEKVDFSDPLGAFENLVVLCSEHIGVATIEFTQLKSNFCRDVVFEDACKSFKMLLEKYRKTRKQYMEGMLSLHSS